MINTQLDMNNITLGEWLPLWYETYKVPFLKKYSLRNIEQQIRLHTPSWLKEKRLKDITLFDIDRALLPIPPGRTRKYTRQVWHNAFKKAQQLDIIDKNVLTLTDEIRYKKQKSKPLTMAEQKNFIEALDGKCYKYVMLFYLYTGVRRSEALTLEWKDIEKESGLILIKGTKTEDSYRHIILTDAVKQILDAQRKQNKEKGYQGSKVFPYSKQQVSKNFKKVCPNHHLHDLRHTFITRCAECGVNVNVCQQLVGHATADMTINVYTHVMDEFKRREALKFTPFPKLY